MIVQRVAGVKVSRETIDNNHIGFQLSENAGLEHKMPFPDGYRGIMGLKNTNTSAKPWSATPTVSLKIFAAMS